VGNWGVIEWSAFVVGIGLVFGSIGSAVTTFIHGWRARERMFARLEAVENGLQADHRKLALLWDARDRGVPGLGTQTGFDGRGVRNPLLDEE
jgi:hypothetical protein